MKLSTPTRTLSLAISAIAAIALLTAPAAQAGDCPETAPGTLPAGCVKDVFSGEHHIQVGLTIYTGDVAADVRIDYGTTDTYGSSLDAGSVAANSIEHIAPQIDGLSADTEYHFRVVVGGWDSGDRTMLTRPAVPVNLKAPTVIGQPYPGETLVCDPGQWSVSTAYSYVWEQNDEPIAGSDSPVHAVGSGEIGSSISCTVTALRSPLPEASAVPVTIVARPTKSVAGSSAQSCVVPNLSRVTLAQARRSLSSANCRTGKVKHAYSSRVPKGRVVRHSPAKGATLAAGAKVALTISKGKRPSRH